jgi:hypothetical protein
MTQYTVVGREAGTADPIARPDLIFETVGDYIALRTASVGLRNMRRWITPVN